MTLTVGSKSWSISTANQSYARNGYTFTMIFDDATLDIEQLATDLSNVSEGFTFESTTYTGYSVQSLQKNYESDRAIITLSLYKAKDL